LNIIFPFKIFGYGENVVMFPLKWNSFGFDDGVEKEGEKFKKSRG